MTTLELRFLGGLTIQQAGLPGGALKTQKGQALLCYLALTGKAHTRPALAALLWPEMAEVNALMNLRKALSQLNRQLAPYLVLTRQTVAFNVNHQDASYWLDVTEFQMGAAARSDVARLQQAVALYRGDFLEGFDLADAPAFDGWMLGWRAQLRELALSALQRLVLHFAATAEYERAVTYARQLLSIEPWREEGHRELMRLLALSDQRSAALKQYELCCAILADELGVEPAPATVALYRQIKENQITPAWPAQPGEAAMDGRSVMPIAAQPSWLPSSRPHNLPAPSTRFIGRQAELAALHQLLVVPYQRLITITGMGGIGKTRLALAVAEQQAMKGMETSPFADGIYLVSLAPLRAAEQILPALAQAIGFPIRSDDRRAPDQQLLDFLKQKQMLLVLDNFEHLLAGATLVADLLKAAPHVKILATSREPLGLYEEQLFPLEGLAYYQEVVSEADPAVQLFLERARHLQPNFGLQPADRPAMTVICRQVMGLPLGLELAATWVDTLPLANIATELEKSLDLLATNWRNVPDRHRSLTAVFDASWHRLGERERQLFQQLCLTRGGFTAEAAMTIGSLSSTGLPLLAALVQKSFLQAPSNGRYQIHELLRQYGLARLMAEPSAVAAAGQRHGRYYLTRLQQRDEALGGADQPAVLADLDVDLENIGNAWEWAVHQDERELLAAAVDSLGLYCEWRGYYRLGKRLVQLVTESSRQSHFLSDRAGQLLVAGCLLWQSVFDRMLGHVQEAGELLEESLAIWQQLPPESKKGQKGLANAWLRQAVMYATSDLGRAAGCYQRSLALFRTLKDDLGQAQAVEGLGVIAFHQGNYEAARTMLEESLAVHERSGNMQKMAAVVGRLASVATYVGNIAEAERLTQVAYELHSQLGHGSGRAGGLIRLSVTLFWMGRFGEALPHLQEALVLYRELGDQHRQCSTLARVALAHAHLGDTEVARTIGEEVLTMAQVMKERQVEGAVLWYLGWIALVEEVYDLAESRLKASIVVHETLGRRGETGWPLATLGILYRSWGKSQEAWACLAKALEMGLAVWDFLTVLTAIQGAALLLADAGAHEEALRLYSLAFRHPVIAHSYLNRQGVGQHVEAVSAALPTIMATRAREEGAKQNLWQTAKQLWALANEHAG